MSEGSMESYPPNMGLAEAKVNFYFRFEDRQQADVFRLAIDSRISGLEVKAEGDKVHMAADIDSFKHLKAQIDRISDFVIGATRSDLQTSLAS